jgi:hypothetical protein
VWSARNTYKVWEGDSRGGLAGGGDGLRDGFGAVDEVLAVMADDGHLGHRGLEGVGHLFLLVDEALPCACGAGVTREVEVGLEADLADVCARADGERGQ